jgi:hypothetical protein
MFIADNSTETFWESGDEDRNKLKTITITCQGQANPRIIYVHIDNTRDLAVSSNITLPELFNLHLILVCYIWKLHACRWAQNYFFTKSTEILREVKILTFQVIIYMLHAMNSWFCRIYHHIFTVTNAVRAFFVYFDYYLVILC